MARPVYTDLLELVVEVDLDVELLEACCPPEDADDDAADRALLVTTLAGAEVTAFTGTVRVMVGWPAQAVQTVTVVTNPGGMVA